MEYFKSGLKSVLGTPQPGAQPTEAETVSCTLYLKTALFQYITSLFPVTLLSLSIFILRLNAS